MTFQGEMNRAERERYVANALHEISQADLTQELRDLLNDMSKSHVREDFRLRLAAIIDARSYLSPKPLKP